MAVVIFGLSAAAWLKAPDDFSDSERRELEKFPKLSVEAIGDGSFMDDFESYTLDQFPFRDAFRRLKAETVFGVLGQKDNNNIYVADGYASKMEYPLNEPMLDHAAERFEFLYEAYLQDAENIYFSIVPDKNYFLAEENGYLSLDYEKLIGCMKEKTGYMTYVDLTEHLELEDYYYTDTHWRQENLTDVADVLLDAMGAGEMAELGADAGVSDGDSVGTPVDGTENSSLQDGYEVKELDLPFYGVYYGQAALPMEPDRLKYLINDTLENCIVTSYDTGSPVEIPMYDMEKAGGKDPYEMFLSGTRAVLTIENPQVKNGKELIVFRDSFGSSLIPLLAKGYETITVLDIRYVNSAMLGQFVEFGDQDVLFLYSTMLLNNSLALK
ncbi:MAG: hypothetical protein IJ374_08290 [Lachnospiraceae bacterium]|nr:hypothetical protein [Lachnospiraceae bacterium]